MKAPAVVCFVALVVFVMGISLGLAGRSLWYVRKAPDDKCTVTKTAFRTTETMAGPFKDRREAARFIKEHCLAASTKGLAQK